MVADTHPEVLETALVSIKNAAVKQSAPVDDTREDGKTDID